MLYYTIHRECKVKVEVERDRYRGEIRYHCPACDRKFDVDDTEIRTVPAWGEEED